MYCIKISASSVLFLQWESNSNTCIKEWIQMTYRSLILAGKLILLLNVDSVLFITYAYILILSLQCQFLAIFTVTTNWTCCLLRGGSLFTLTKSSDPFSFDKIYSWHCVHLLLNIISHHIPSSHFKYSSHKFILFYNFFVSCCYCPNLALIT